MLINCETNPITTCSARFLVAATLVNQVSAFAITDTKPCASVLTLSTQDNVKLLQQLKSGFKRTSNWNKYQSKLSMERTNQYLDNLIESRYSGVNTFFALSFEDNDNRTSYRQYFLPTIEIKCCNFMISGL